MGDAPVCPEAVSLLACLPARPTVSKSSFSAPMDDVDEAKMLNTLPSTN
jgi:hypothetical protein